MTTFKSMMKDVYGEDYWENGVGSNYWRYGNDPGWQETVSAMIQFLPLDSVLYEVACAKGYFVQTASRLFDHVEGMDISAHALARAPQDVRALLHHGNATSLPWPSQSADAICSWEFLEHVPETELDRVLDEMERVLKPGGWLWHRIGTLEEGDDRSNHMADHTHVTNHDGDWWRTRFYDRMWQFQGDAVGALNRRFRERDWWGRFFVYRLPESRN